VPFGEGTSDRGKRSLADFGRSWSDRDKGSLATVGEGSESDRDKRSLEVSAPPRARESETAFADFRSFPPRPASHSSEVAREINTVPFGEGTFDGGKRSLADFGRSWSDRDKESLEESAPPRARESETAFADFRSFPPRPASHSSEVPREINNVAIGEASECGKRSLAAFG